jgi:hypothetical protein
MDHNELLVLAIVNLPTIIAVLIGILLNNARTSDLNSRLESVERQLGNLDGRLGGMDHRIASLGQKFDTRVELLLGKVVDIDNRVTRIESQDRLPTL